MIYQHISVMRTEVAHYMNCQSGQTHVDCTLGGSGHARDILDRIQPDGVLIGIDQDPEAIRHGKEILQPDAPNVRLFHDNFIHLKQILSQLNIFAVDGILLDLGISFYHLEGSGRGFSFNKDEPLDMRMNPDADETAEDLVNNLSEMELKRIFLEYGEERWSGRIARNIVIERGKNKITSSLQLSQIVRNAAPKIKSTLRKIDPATRVFMALRIAVNHELESLHIFLENVADVLKPMGRLCIISFHSLEDRMVKQHMKGLEKGCICPPDFPKCVCGKKPVMRSLTKKVIRPTEREITANPMARSARLRAFERL